MLLLFGISGPSFAQEDKDNVTNLKGVFREARGRNAAIKAELADLKQGLSALGRGGAAQRQAEKTPGPTPIDGPRQTGPARVSSGCSTGCRKTGLTSSNSRDTKQVRWSSPAIP